MIQNLILVQPHVLCFIFFFYYTYFLKALNKLINYSESQKSLLNYYFFRFPITERKKKNILIVKKLLDDRKRKQERSRRIEKVIKKIKM